MKRKEYDKALSDYKTALNIKHDDPSIHNMNGEKMKKQKKSILVLAVMVVFICTGLFLPGLVVAGDLDQPVPPDDSDGAMHTLEDIYNRLNNNTVANKRTGGFTEPSVEPGSTGHTMDQIYDLVIPAKVEKTGRATLYATGDDGELTKGEKLPNPRFTDNGDGTVTDNLTGLIWLKNAICFGQREWDDALIACNNLSSGSCGLTDGSSAGDWRLPNVKELQSLIVFGESNPALPSGHPFTGVQSYYYWASTAYAGTHTAGRVYVPIGGVYTYDKRTYSYVWPVRRSN